jgi:hypothetical protein
VLPSGGHAATFFCATAASLRAFLAMFRFVFATLFAAGFTNFGTDTADLGGFAAAKAHQLCSGITDSGTFHIQLNATCHHFYVFFLRTGRGAMITNGGTTQTGIDAGLVLVIISGHNKWFYG